MIKLEKIILYDASIIAKYANNMNIWKNVTDSFPCPYFIENAIDYINIVTKKKPIQDFKITKNNEFVGLISAGLKSNIYSKTAEIGYWLAEPFWGQGIMTQAVKMIVSQTFESFDFIEKITAKVYHTNIGSMRVLEKSGFHKEAILVKEAFKENEFKDIHYYALFRKK